MQTHTRANVHGKFSKQISYDINNNKHGGLSSLAKGGEGVVTI